MLAALRCPTCSAPLDAPGLAARSLTCPYCGASVLLTGGSGAAAAPAESGHREAIVEVLRLLRAGQKIEAIKVFRERFGVGLKVAKDAVERLAAGQAAGSIPVAAVGRKLGAACSVVVLLVMLMIGVGVWLSTRVIDGATEIARSLEPPAPGAAPAAPGFAREVLRFGSEGIGAGRFDDARGVAVDGDGRIYVAEYQGGRVQVFDSLGAFRTQWMADPETPLVAIAADRGGTVYVVQGGGIHRFEGASGTRLPDLAGGGSDNYDDVVLALDGSLYATENDGVIHHLSRDGDVIGRVDVRAAVGERASPERVAVSGTGELYVIDMWTDEVYHFAPDGRFVDRFGGNGDRPDNLGSPSDLAVDGRGRLYVSDLGAGIRVFDASGHFLDAFGGSEVVFGIALSDSDELVAAFRNRHEVVKYRLPG